MKYSRLISLICLIVASTGSLSHASVIVYNSTGNPSAKSEWQVASGTYATITFAELGLPPATWLTDQYSYLGVHFTDGSDQVYTTDTFIIDGIGLNGAFDETTLQFDVPMTSIALDFPGSCAIKLFFNGEQIYQSPLLGSGGVGKFAGLISTEPFDSAQLYDPFGGFFADNIHFGPPIPAPSALAILGVVGLLGGRRRRRE